MEEKLRGRKIPNTTALNQIIEFFEHLFGTESWPPRWRCGEWTEFHGWLYIGSDLAVWAAYFTIPLLLFYFIQHKPSAPFPRDIL